MLNGVVTLENSLAALPQNDKQSYQRDDPASLPLVIYP
jgi:hypothetical protein